MDTALTKGSIRLDPLRTGPTLRRARELSGVARSSAATAVGVSRRELTRIERGHRPATIDLVRRAVHVYGGDELALPPREDLVRPDDPTLLLVGSERIRVDPFRRSDREVLAAYVAAVRRQRGVADDAEIAFRSHDLVQLAGVLDLSSADLEGRLRDVMGLVTSDAIRTSRALVLTGLCLAIAGAVWRDELLSAPCRPRANGTGVFGVAPSSPHEERPLFAVPDVGVDGLATARPVVVAGPGDGSWLSRDTRSPVFSVVPPERFAALAELVGDSPRAVAEAGRGAIGGPALTVPPEPDAPRGIPAAIGPS